MDGEEDFWEGVGCASHSRGEMRGCEHYFGVVKVVIVVMVVVVGCGVREL